MNACLPGDCVAAVVLAAGRSRRMGRPKLGLPWGATTVIGQVVSVLDAAGLGELLVVTGAAREEVAACLAGSRARLVHNPHFAEWEMLVSLQAGLAALLEAPASPAGRPLEAALVCLGDQPQIELGVVQRLLDEFTQGRPGLVFPSYQMRRGHPWLVARPLWAELLQLSPERSLRDFVQSHASAIRYVPVDRPSILKDLDTPEDWENERPTP